MIPLKEMQSTAWDSPSHFLTPHLVLTSHVLAVAQPPPVPGQGGSCALLPPQLGQLLPAVSLLA